MTGSEKSTKWFLKERRLQSQKLAALGELSAGIAHEINNPLAIIRQEAELMDYTLKEGRVKPPDLKELQGSVHMIIQQVDRCTGIIRNLLNFARRREPVVQAVDVNRIIEDMTMLVEKEARNNNINLERHYDRELPRIYSDAPQLRQVILNLLTNASQAVGHDGTITSSRTQAAKDSAIAQRKTAAGLTLTRLLSGSTTASSSTMSRPPQAPGPGQLLRTTACRSSSRT